ncbi:hypothetical protein RRG08_036936 [Elysia crispata]|uniref:Uncharacterized protein n=1 Tax=Elysia crispata TaxID=231223 RepID=A0AAE1DGN6_9GAST|nr:hypothetical protein RRG08_036936 [Elysia crispata]
MSVVGWEIDLLFYNECCRLGDISLVLSATLIRFWLRVTTAEREEGEGRMTDLRDLRHGSDYFGQAVKSRQLPFCLLRARHCVTPYMKLLYPSGLHNSNIPSENSSETQALTKKITSSLRYLVLCRPSELSALHRSGPDDVLGNSETAGSQAAGETNSLFDEFLSSQTKRFVQSSVWPGASNLRLEMADIKKFGGGKPRKLSTVT